ncbi:serine protease inhibitor [Moniliophthora roreri MCA 2997]|uniref:Serine protease inhibitor n=2 Tax=Moniliophthora roreri TaxID=221103 RepID=V2X2P8_MONRO|nr:serine protease inhibitor [Moniliophthora roreri MCA 2997]KAI3621089.1 serine protease inhibitor [Moniliophthora roreri]
MPLETGYYLIQNQGKFLGASTEEPLVPRRIIVLPGGVEAPKFFVEKFGENRYAITIDNARTRPIEDKVFAITVVGPPPELWHIKADGGEDSYIVETTERARGWISPNEPYGQIMCRELVVTPSYEAFQFIPAPDN